MENARINAFATQLQIVQYRVNYFYAKGAVSYQNFGIEIGTSNEYYNQMVTAMQSVYNLSEEQAKTKLQNYKYFPKEELEKIGAEDVEIPIIINFTTRDVIGITGVKKNNVICYRLEELGESYNVEYIEPESTMPAFSLRKTIQGLNGTIYIDNITYNGDIKRGNIYYGRVTNIQSDPVEVEYWQEISSTSIYVDKSGIYAVKIVDALGNENTELIEVTLANAPELSDGMYPVIYDINTQKWKVVSSNSGEWYDYSSDEKRWANVMLNDNLELEADGVTVKTMGSMFVWVPRYAYSITSGWHSSTTGTIEIKFLQGVTDIPTDYEVNITDERIDRKPIINTENTAMTNYVVHPCFTNGNSNNFANGEWGTELKGIWVAKFEASSDNPQEGSNLGGGNRTDLHIKVLPNVTSWRGNSVTNIFIVCNNMLKENANFYGMANGVLDSHMMKNSEWGAVAYLAQSNYGNKQENDLESGIWNNIYHNGDSYDTTKTGVSGATREEKTSKSEIASEYYEYNTTNGVKASTTRNVYGIYDMVGGAYEYTASYVDNENMREPTTETTNNKYESNKELILSARKYKNIYNVGQNDDELSNYETAREKFGDATYEISKIISSTGHEAWNQDISQFPSTYNPVFVRGGAYYDEYAGIFNFGFATGENYNYISFRPVIVAK